MTTYTSQPSSFLFSNLKLHFQRIPKERSFGKSGIFGEWIKVVVDKPLNDDREKDAKRTMLCIFPPQPDLFGVTIKPSFSLSLFTRFYKSE